VPDTNDLVVIVEFTWIQ